MEHTLVQKQSYAPRLTKLQILKLHDDASDLRDTRILLWKWFHALRYAASTSHHFRCNRGFYWISAELLCCLALLQAQSFFSYLNLRFNRILSPFFIFSLQLSVRQRQSEGKPWREGTWDQGFGIWISIVWWSIIYQFYIFEMKLLSSDVSHDRGLKGGFIQR